MKRIVPIVFAFVALFIVSGSTLAQRNIAPKIERDPVLEADAKHNLEVSWQYFRLKKAYKAVLGRYEETAAAHPDFSKMDEFLYLAGMSAYYLADNKGRQKIDMNMEKDKDKFAPEKLRSDAVMYLSMMLEKNPESKYKEDADKVLKELKAK
jgi:outer membrane protein assembly factor BamD (BamD/ComL family)